MPQLVDERTLLSNMAPNQGDMAAVAELDPRTWQGQLRRNKLSAFVDPYQLLMPDPDSTYGTLVPAARDNATGEMRFALPAMLRDIGIGGLDALAGRQVGELTPLATGAISALPFGGAAPSGSLRAGAALRTQRAVTPKAAMEAARTASTNSARQAWVWKTPEGKFLVNAGDRPEGAKLVGRAIGDEWFSGPGLMAKSGDDSVGAAQAYGKSVANINIPEGAATNLSQLLPSRMPRDAQETFFPLQSIKHGATPEQSALILKRLQERAGNDEFFNRMLYLEKRYEDSKLPGSVERLTPEELQELKTYTDNWYNKLGREDQR